MRVTVPAFAMLLWMGTGAIARPPSRTVLTIHFGSESFPSNPVLDAAIRETLLSRVRAPIDYFAEYLKSDLRRETASGALAENIRAKYRTRRIDVVIAMTDQSLRFVLDHRELFPRAPVVFSVASEPPDLTRDAGGAGFTGVKVSNAYAATLKQALALHPATRTIYIVANAPDRTTADVVRNEFRAASAVPVVAIEADTIASLLRQVRAVPPQSLIIYVWHTSDERGNLVYPDEIAREVAAAAPVPVYGTSDFYIGTGVVGGVMRRTRDTGIRVGELASRILNGARPQDLPVEMARVVPIFDWRQMQRWQIGPRQLPPDADVQFRTPTVWESYGAYIIVIAGVVSAQLLLIAGLLTQRAQRHSAEEVIRNREATLRRSYDRIRQLAAGLIHAQEATRADIARDLHDGVCQQLAGVSLEVSALKSSSGRIQDERTQRHLTKIQSEARNIYEEMRRLSHELHPATLRLLGLASALKTHCGEVRKRHGVEASFCASGPVGELSPDIAVALFRIAQESLRNAIEHGGARRLAVSVSVSAGHFELTVTDDGQGFDVQAVRDEGKGLGLVSLEERARAFGGVVDVTSAPSQGTTIRVGGPASVPQGAHANNGYATSA